MKRKALSAKNATRRIPLANTLLWWLIADRFHPSPLAWGIIYTLLAIMALIQVIDFFTAEDVELPPNPR